ncbi:alpha-L-fucosidase [Rubellicoccus peritrichatus]|uniref:alpha-L-fucosidase n=1 Tax=Rubellicoccus peritrichatus TaxID=3080537 RepID=A0AAQ3L6J3_9BACT|nr:alpha-L-fucosidase [Puniceicoccus sp. CR14]WOO39921.1 alpha-L-fucosidase [Puniceicoccus sp. CR14]
MNNLKSTILLGIAATLFTQPLVSSLHGEEAEPVYQANWQSLMNHQTPEWLADEKFGIFIHWMPNSVPAFHDEWYARWMYREGHPVFSHHRETWGDQKEFGYKDFIPMFKAEKWDPEEWAKFFKSVGARFVVPNAEHHDHFALWDSDLTKWDSVEMGPKRDIVGELGEAVRKEGMYYGVSNHRARGWNFYTYKPEFDTMNPDYADFYWPQLGKKPDQEWLEDWQARLHELVDKYHPDLMWFDYGWVAPEFESYKKDYVAYYYNQAVDRGQPVAIIYKGDHLPPGVGVLDVERGKLDRLWPELWMTDTTVFENTWGYVEGAPMKEINTLLHDLIDIVSKNGVLLLNVGPKADGTIPQDQRDVLIGIGDWLAVNGDSIYGTRPFDVFKEGDDIRFTRKGNAIYAIFLEKPEGEVVIESLVKNKLGGLSVTDVQLLADDLELAWSEEKDGLKIDFPKNLPGTRAWAVKVSLEGIGFSAPDVTIVHGSAGGEVDAYGKVYNFTDKDQSINASFFANKQRMGPVGQVDLTPGEWGDIRYNHRDQNHYGATDMLLTNMTDGVYTFAFGKKRPESPTVTIALPSIPMKGEWLFIEADEASFSEAEFDDSGWKKTLVPREWPIGRHEKGIEKVGWFRKDVMIPESWKGNDLFMDLGVIKDSDTVYFNGHKIGEKAYEKVEFHFAYEIRKFEIPAKYVNFGGENTIAVRVQSQSGKGGLVGPPGYITVAK